MVTTELTAQPIPTPADFPVGWEQPEDERLFWQTERMHWPDLLTPMDFAILRAALDQLTWSFASYGVPLAYSARHINYRWYFSVNPNVDDLSLMPALMKTGIANLETTIARLVEHWSTEWLPEVLEHLEFWERFDLAGATLPELQDHFDETLVRHNRVWQLHFLQTFPVYMAMSAFDDFYQELFDGASGLDAYRLMQGLDNKTVQMGQAFWRLSRRVLASPELRAAFASEDASAILAALGESAEGRVFLTEFDELLNEYGRRGDKFGVSFVSWREDPSPAIRQLREYVSQPNFDHEAEMTALTDEREQALAEARATLAGYPKPIVEQFETMLVRAQQATIISEDHNTYIDFGEMDQVRQVIIEFGRRFTEAGVITEPQDIFMLTPGELRETAERLGQINRQAIVAAREAEMARFRDIPAPPALGTPPAAPPPDDPLSRALGKFFGMPAPEPETSDGALVVYGGSGSPGKTQGIARVILSLSDAGRLAEGDILVAPTTVPAWTPLFATAAAVVTDTGGVLSHSAVVAREYRIPAVVGASSATTVIQDGDLIEVDGDSGIVRILRRD